MDITGGSPTWAPTSMTSRPRSLAHATEGVSAVQQANRERLRTAMSAGGLTVYSGEWWHFDGPGADVPRPILDVPVN
jgi:D-alanyl-D-alanine dipeptidase